MCHIRWIRLLRMAVLIGVNLCLGNLFRGLSISLSSQLDPFLATIQHDGGRVRPDVRSLTEVLAPGLHGNGSRPVILEDEASNSNSGGGGGGDDASSSSAISFCHTPWPLKMPTQIFTCGHDNVELFKQVFPEFEHVQRTVRLTRTNTPNTTFLDVLVVGMGGLCGGWGAMDKLGVEFFENHFPGFVFHFNGESQGGERWEAIGTYATNASATPSTTKIRRRVTQATTNREDHDAARSNGNTSLAKSYISTPLLPPLRNIHIGYVADSSHSVWVPFASQYIAKCGARLQQRLFVPTKKPRNTLEHFMIYTASNCKVPYREEAVDSIASRVGQSIDQGGKCWGKSHNRSLVRKPSMPLPKGRFHWMNNHYHYRHYRFCLVLENTKKDGYITEKIVMAFLAGCIPVYYGTKQVFDMFNAKAFIYYDIDNPEPAIRAIAHLERNRTAYNAVLLEQPILAQGNETIRRYFSLNDAIGNGFVKNKIRERVCLDGHEHAKEQKS